MRKTSSPARPRAALVLMAALGACESRGVRDPAAPGTTLTVTVQPLSLEGIRDAVYHLVIERLDGERVVERRDLGSDRFGDGQGSLTYVAPCVGGESQRVRLVLADLFEGDAATDRVDPATYVNPCGELGDPVDPSDDVNWDGFACVREVTCRENADTLVKFDLVVARDARQGFFDVAINFSDVFCSAKVDCVDAMLHDADGERSRTAIIGFACTAGLDQDTILYMNDWRVTCLGPPPVTFYFDPSQGPGQHGALPPPPAAPALFQTASYFGREGFDDLDKCYWNHALGLNEAALLALGDCTLHGRATASDRPFAAPPHTSPANTSWPVITFTVPLTRGGALVCDDVSYPLGSPEVMTSYGPLLGERFTHAMACGEPPRDDRTVCGGASDPVTFTQTFDGVVVSVPGVGSSAPYDLADGLTLDTCCGDPCCQP